MRSSKELILASKAFTKEDRFRSWMETIFTLVALIIFMTFTFINFPLPIRLFFSFACSLFFVRMFVIYHDYQHHAILQGSNAADIIMKAFGIFMLTPQNIWKRSHDHHHNHNSKLTITGIGSYPTITKERYLKLSRAEKNLYLLNRHPLTVIFGYLTLFIYWLNVKSVMQSPKKHWDSLLALIFHFGAGGAIYYYFGGGTFIISWFLPFLVSFAFGSYLFYSQHNFPGAQFRENHDWKYEHAALSSTSFMKMHPIMQWLTGYIGYHHVHHLNSRIPFYRLTEAMDKMPELQKVSTTSMNPFDIWNCFALKLWDTEKNSMISLKGIYR